MNIVDKWDQAINLKEAFDVFADPFQQREFRAASNVGPIMVIKRLMFADLFMKLASEELQAIGFKVTPEPSGELVLIPAISFIQEPSIADCEDNRVVASGIAYDRVKVTDALEPIDEISAPKEHIKPPRAKAGRQSLEEPIMATLEELYQEDPSFIRRSAGRLIDLFNERFKKHAQAAGWGDLSVSERTLRKYLLQYQKQLEEIGKI